jgi:hypothetical protein
MIPKISKEILSLINAKHSVLNTLLKLFILLMKTHAQGSDYQA